MMRIKANPCLKCGACCAHYRVSFYWGEADPEQPCSIPLELTEQLSGFRNCMKGTNQVKPHCIALQGEIGRQVSCMIYDQRPTVCREFGIRHEHGSVVSVAEDLQRCNQARQAHGLPALRIGGRRTQQPRSRFPIHHKPMRRRRRPGGSTPTGPGNPPGDLAST